MVEDVIREFVESLFEEAGLNSLPEAFRQEYVEKVAVQAQQRLGMVALRELDSAGLEQFAELVDAENVDQTKVLRFFESHVPDFQNKMKRALQDFATEFLRDVERLRAKGA